MKRLIVITGASRGLGKQVAIECSDHNTRLVLQGRDLNQLDQVSQECEKRGATVRAVITDFAEDDYATSFAEVLTEEISKDFDITD